MKGENIYLILFRYLVLLIIAVYALPSFYKIFLPLTIYPSNFLLNLFYNSSIHANSIITSSFKIDLVEACIASSAYFLLLLLNLSIPMNYKKRLLSLAFSILIFLVLNIIRIFAFSLLYVNNYKYFDLVHVIFWYLISGLFVFLAWLITIKTFKIKEAPFYTDLKKVYSKI